MPRQPDDLKAKARYLRANMTAPEWRLWYELRGKRFRGVKFTKQSMIAGVIPDFAARMRKLIIELDGDTHGATEAYDARRTEKLEQRGYRVIRFSNADVMENLEGVLDEIGRQLDSAPLPDPLPLGEREKKAFTVRLDTPDDFDGWRDAARALVLAGQPPEQVVWKAGEIDLFDAATNLPEMNGTLTVPRDFVALAKSVVCHSDPERFALLYTLLWRLQTTKGLIHDHADPLVRRCDELAKGVRRDIHKMRAFVRFRELDGRYVAWFEPDHHIVRVNAAFFVRRFASMKWSILTPEVSIHWDGNTLAEGSGALKSDAPSGDPVEEMWKTYYASTFNPARVKMGAMLKEMPRKYWKNMPETALVPHLLATAQARVAGMIERSDTLGKNSKVVSETAV